VWLLTVSAVLGCNPTTNSSDSTPSSLPVAASASSSAKPASSADGRCGPLACRLFDSPKQAFAAVMASKPLVLAVGEAHAQKGSGRITSATKRFGDTLLPTLEGVASDVVVELLVADKSCRPTVKKVAKVQKVVTRKQRKSNKNEFLQLGHRAKKLGMVAHPLRPNCADYQAVVKAGPDGLVKMLGMIAELTEAKVKRLLERNRKQPPAKLVVAYGGALHNDLSPPKNRAKWSFGPQLQRFSNDRYVALDLIVPEFIKATASWKRLPWYRHYHPSKFRHKTVLYRTEASSYVLIFPFSKSPPAAAGGAAPH